MITHEEYVKRRDEIAHRTLHSGYQLYGLERVPGNNDVREVREDEISKAQRAIDALVLDVIGDDSSWTYEECMQFSTSVIDSINHEFAVNITKKDQRSIIKGETQ